MSSDTYQSEDEELKGVFCSSDNFYQQFNSL
jgi:hypothetical protein